jgi:predicted Zn-dependent protease
MRRVGAPRFAKQQGGYMRNQSGQVTRAGGCAVAVLLAGLAAQPAQAQRILDKLRDRLGPAADVVETVVENREAFQGFSEEEEIQIARENSGQFDGQAVFWDDPMLESYLNGVVQRLAVHAKPRPFKYRIKVVKDPAVNAFTFGAGYLYVNAGLLARMDNEAQVAMVLAHEIAHAAESHVTNGMKANAGITMLGQLAGRAAASSGRIDYEVLQKTYHYSMNAAINGHGRSQESEADELGLDYLFKAGYDPREASSTFEQLLKEHGDPSAMDSFFYSSHPRNQERMERTAEWVKSRYAESLVSGDRVTNSQEFQDVVHEVVVAVGEHDYNEDRMNTAQAMFEKAAADGVPDARPHHYLALVALDTDVGAEGANRAIPYLRAALAVDEKYAAAHKGLGVAFDRLGDRASAADSYERYLALEPRATDAAEIQRYIRRVRE